MAIRHQLQKGGLEAPPALLMIEAFAPHKELPCAAC